MESHKGSTRVVHSYDPEHRRILCGVTEQTNSTKHAAGVTCASCRELLRAARAAAAEAAGAAAAQGA